MGIALVWIMKRDYRGYDSLSLSLLERRNRSKFLIVESPRCTISIVITDDRLFAIFLFLSDAKRVFRI